MNLFILEIKMPNTYRETRVALGILVRGADFGEDAPALLAGLYEILCECVRYA